MSTPKRDDPLWQAAWQWVLRERDGVWTADDRVELLAWLAADPVHRAHYEDASKLWLQGSLMPTRYVDPDPDSPLDLEALRRIAHGDDQAGGSK